MCLCATKLAPYPLIQLKLSAVDEGGVGAGRVVAVLDRPERRGVRGGGQEKKLEEEEELEEVLE